MISNFWKNLKLTGQLELVFITLFSVIMILSYFNFRTLGITSKELTTLQELENDYSKLITQLKNLTRNSATLQNSEKLSQINNLIGKEFDRKFQVYLSEAAFNETKELEEIKTRATKNNNKDVIFAWSLIGLSLGFSFFAFKMK